MFQAQEQVAVEIKEEQAEVVELTEADLQWIGGGSSIYDGTY